MALLQSFEMSLYSLKNMLKNSAWQCIVILSVALSAHFIKAENEENNLENQWNDCCEKNLCIQNSCYSLELRASSWASVRQRCQNKYPQWSEHIDLFQIDENWRNNKTWMQLIDAHADLPSSIWSGGVFCPISGIEDFVGGKWISSSNEFPDWLKTSINYSVPETDISKRNCTFLVVFISVNTSGIQYEFQPEQARHAGLCEFHFPGTRTTTQSTILESTWTKYTTDKDFITSKTLELAEWKHHWSEGISSTETSSTVTSSTDTSSTKISSTETSSTKTSSPLKTTSKSDFYSSTFPSGQTGLCKGVEAEGISWPDTLPGALVKVSCPFGMTGTAHWYCNETTLQFSPEKPLILDCKHIWIKELEDHVEDGTDAVIISSKLAEESGNKSISHGDISALVNLSAKLLHLYVAQKGEEEYEVSDRVPVSYTFTRSIVSAMSNVLRQEIKTAWDSLPEDHQTEVAANILKVVSTIGGRLSCIKKSSEKLQFTVATQNIELETFILNSTQKEERDTPSFVTFPQKTKNNLMIVPENLPQINGYCKTYNSAFGVLYNNVGDFLKDKQLSGTSSRSVLATRVISFSASKDAESVQLLEDQYVSVTLQHIIQLDNSNLFKPRCVFWNFSKESIGQWDSSGCYVSEWNDTHTVCKCNHLTNFAVLMDVNGDLKDNAILSLLTSVCCGVSSITLFLTLICFLLIRSLRDRRSIITGNLCFSLLMTNLLVIFGLNQTQNKILCACIAGLLHFWLLSAFFWMLIEGYHLYRMIILVFQRGHTLSVKIYYIFAYGTSLLVVAISAGLRTSDYASKDYCWLSSNNGLIWSFVGPACLIILINSIIFVLALRSASNVKIKREQSTIQSIKSWIRGSLSVMCLLGLTWCLGLFYINKNLGVFSYIFTVFNGLQGVFIFFFHIILNDKFIASVCKWNKHLYSRKSLNQTTSNRFQSKSSSRSANSTKRQTLRTTSSSLSVQTTELRKPTNAPDVVLEAMRCPRVSSIKPVIISFSEENCSEAQRAGMRIRTLSYEASSRNKPNH